MYYWYMYTYWCNIGKIIGKILGVFLVYDVLCIIDYLILINVYIYISLVSIALNVGKTIINSTHFWGNMGEWFIL
jgi:hypothetical protein